MLNLVRQFSEERLRDLCEMISADIQQVVSDRTNWMRSVADCCKNYLGEEDEERVLPWEDASDAFIPMTMISVETAHPRMLSGVLGLNQVVAAEPTGGTSAETANRISNFMNWALLSHSQVNAYSKMDRILHASSLYGRTYSGLSWEKNRKTVTRMFTVPRYQQGAGELMKAFRESPTKPFNNVSLEVPYAMSLETIIGKSLIDVHGPYNEAEGARMEFRVYVDNRISHGEAFIPTPEPGRTMIDIFVTIEELHKNAPTLEALNIADCYQPVDEPDLESASYFAHRYWMDLEDLYRDKQEGVMYFEDEIWERIVRGTSVWDGDMDSDQDFNLYIGARDARPSASSTINESNVRDIVAKAHGDSATSNAYSGIECIAYHRQMRFDGRIRDYVIYYFPEYDTIGRIVELGVISPTGRRPFHTWEFMRALDDSTRSMGIGHIIMDLQSILNDVFNKQIDRDDLLTMPFGFYKPTAFKKGTIHKLSPGMLIPTSDPSAVSFPNFGRPLGADMPYIQQLLGFVERLTSATNYFQGSSPSTPNAPRTFGATAAIIQEGNINFELHTRRYQNVLYSICRDLQGLYRHFMPKELEFLAPGADTLMKISREDLDSEVGFVFKANASNTNPAIKQQMSQLVYSSLVMNPIIQSNVQAFYNITRRFALAHDYVEFDQDVPKPAPEQSHAPMTQLEEIQAMAMGTNVAALPTDNHEEHLKVITEFFASDYGAQIDQKLVAALMAHAQQHQQMYAMMQRAAMTQQGNGVQPGFGVNPGSSNPTGADTGNPGAGAPPGVQGAAQ